ILLAMHRNFKTVTEINVNNPARNAVEKQVGWVAIAQAENVTDHGHDTKRASVVRASLEPGFGALTLEPEDAIQILSGGVVHSIPEDFDLLHEGKVIIVRSHLKHDAVFNVE